MVVRCRRLASRLTTWLELHLILPFDRPVAEIDDNNLAAHPCCESGEEMSEWQPIETAPRDGSEILLFARGPYKDDYRGVGQWSEQRNDWLWSFAIRPTHWMPLPEPPR